MGARIPGGGPERPGGGRAILPVALLGAAVLAAGCSRDSRSPPTERAEDLPVRLREPGPLAWRFPPPDGTILEDALSLRLGPEGLFVLDPMAGRVLHLSLDGELRGVLGRPGSGPGELRGPVGLQLGAGGDVWVGVPAQTRLARFRPDGTVLDEYRTAHPVANFVVTGGRVLAPSLHLDRLLDELGPAGDTLALAPGRDGVPAGLRRGVAARVQFQGALMAAPAAGTVFLLQNGHGEDFSLWKVRVSFGERRVASTEPVPLPGWLYRLMAEDVERLRRELSEEFARGDFMIPFKNLHAHPGGGVTLVPAPSDRVLALSLAADGGVVDVVVPSGAEEHRGLMDAAVGEDRLFALYPTEVRAYALRRRTAPAGDPIPAPVEGSDTVETVGSEGRG